MSRSSGLIHSLADLRVERPLTVQGWDGVRIKVVRRCRVLAIARWTEHRSWPHGARGRVRCDALVSRGAAEIH
jgi:hypothetical protein